MKCVKKMGEAMDEAHFCHGREGEGKERGGKGERKVR